MPLPGRGSFPRSQPQTEFSEPSSAGFGSAPRGQLVSGARIAQYRALKNLPRAEDALQLLRRVGAEVKGIMRKHDWHLPLLTEFSGFSKNGTDLLGMNRNSGQTIYLRLRYPSSDRKLTDTFLPFEDIIGTMLHELAHNKRGPHDEIFYKVLSELEEDWYEMRRNGGWMQGDGFDSHGRTLGNLEGLGPAMQNVPVRQAAQKAAEMAERRRRAEELSRGGPRRLGGLATTGLGVAGAPAQLAQLASQAAERRRHGEQSCPSTLAEGDGAVKWHEEQDLSLGVTVITIDEGEDEIHEDPPHPQHTDRLPKTRQTDDGTARPPTITIDSSSEEEDEDDSQDVIVIKETIKKRPSQRPRIPPDQPRSSSTARRRSQSPPRTRLRGELNISGRVAQEALQSMRARNATSPSEEERTAFWTCQTCTLSNAARRELCQACSAPRPKLSLFDSDQQTAIVLARSKPTERQQHDTKSWQCTACGMVMDRERAELWCCVECGQLARK